MKLIFENLTKEQAVCFAEWFEGQGEQDCVPWVEEQEVENFFVDVDDQQWLKIDEEKQEVIVKIK